MGTGQVRYVGRKVKVQARVLEQSTDSPTVRAIILRNTAPWHAYQIRLQSSSRAATETQARGSDRRHARQFVRLALWRAAGRLPVSRRIMEIKFECECQDWAQQSRRGVRDRSNSCEACRPASIRPGNSVKDSKLGCRTQIKEYC